MRLRAERLKLSRGFGAFDVDIGRQPVTLGTSHFVGVLDVLAPFPPGDLDATYKPGIDAVRVRTLIGEEGEGFSQAMESLVAGRIGVASIGVGLGQGALDAALAYAGEREAFGRPIGEFGGIREQLADCAIDLAAARELTTRAARLHDDEGDSRKAAAQAKLFASESALRVCDRSIQIHGGYGYTDEFPLNRFWRDARLLTIGEGTSEILRGIISRIEFDGV